MIRKTYLIEQLDPETGYWEILHICRPFYRYEGHTRRFLFWKWTRERISNAITAHTDARKRAVLIAKGIYHPLKDIDLRLVESIGNGRQWLERVIWCNGTWL